MYLHENEKKVNFLTLTKISPACLYSHYSREVKVINLKLDRTGALIVEEKKNQNKFVKIFQVFLKVVMVYTYKLVKCIIDFCSISLVNSAAD